MTKENLIRGEKILAELEELNDNLSRILSKSPVDNCFLRGNSCSGVTTSTSQNQ